MVDSIYSGQFDTMIYQLVLQLLENQLSRSNSTDSSLDNSSSNSVQTTRKTNTDIKGSSSASPSSSRDFSAFVQEASAKYSVDPALVNAIIKAESGGNPNAVSSAGAQGLMQLMPATARGLGVSNPMNPEQNIDGGVRFLKGLLNRYGGDTQLAVAAYNAGPGAVDEYDGVPPYQETQVYVERVMGMYNTSKGWNG